MKKIGRNDPCFCGSGKKYKKCCLLKAENKADELKLMEKFNSMDIFAYHDNYIHTRKVIAPKVNKKLLYIYDNKDKMGIKDIIDNYLFVMNYILDYAKENNINDIDKLNEKAIIGDFITNVISDFEEEILNVSKDEYDLNILNNYIDKLVSTLDLDENTYENNLRCKCHNLFKMGEYELGEKVMVNLINSKNNSIYPYVELVDDFEMVGDLKKSKFYYDMGMKTKFDDIDVLEERKNYFNSIIK